MTMKTLDDFFKVPKLTSNGSNWITYKDRLRWALDARGILPHLEGTTTQPTQPQSGDATAFETLAKEWRMGEATVKQYIASTVPDPIFNRIKTQGTANGVWTSLCLIFQGRSTMVAIDLRRRMQDTKCSENEDVRTHFEKIAEMFEQLGSMGITISDDDYLAILLGSLPVCYDSTISSMTTTTSLQQKTLTPDTIICVISDEYDRR